MTHDFDTILKEAARLQKQKEIDGLLLTEPMEFREAYSRRIRKRLKNPPHTIPARQIIAIVLAAVVLLTCLGMALPQIRNSLRRPLLTVDRSFPGHAMELEDGFLHRILTGEDGWILESTDVYTGESTFLPIPAGDDISWIDLSVTKNSFTLLGRDSELRYLALTRDGRIIHDIALTDIDNSLSDPDRPTVQMGLAGEMLVVSRQSVSAKTSKCELHIYDPVGLRHRYVCGNAVTFFQSGEDLYFITDNNQDYPAPGLVYPNTMYAVDSIDSEPRVIWEMTLPFPLTAGELLGYDPDTGILYFTQNLTLGAFDLKHGKTGTAMHSDTLLRVLQIDSGILLYETDGTCRVCRIPDGYFDTADRNQLTGLTIAEPGIPGVTSEAYPEVFRAMWEDGFNLYGNSLLLRDYEETILEKLRNGDSDFDIFYLDSGTAQLFDGNYLEDLTRYPILEPLYGEMLDGVSSLCTEDGVTGLIPLSLYTMMMRQNLSLCTEAIEVPSLLGDLTAMKTAAAPYLNDSAGFMSGSGIHGILIPWAEQIADNYRAGKLNRTRTMEALTDLLALAREFNADPDVFTGSGYSLTRTYLMCVQNTGVLTAYTAHKNAVFSPMLKAAESCSYPFSGSFYAVNPNSPHKKEAAAFLAYLTEYLRTPEAKAPETAQLYRDYTPASASKTACDIFRTQLADSVRSYDIPRFSAYLSDLIPRFISGSITAADAAGQILEYIEQAQ